MSKIDVTKIEGFEQMSAEEKIKALLDAEVDTPKTENNDEVARLKDALNNASSDASKYKKLLREKQTEQEKAEAERAEKEAEREELLKSLMREKEVSTNTAEFLSIGFDTDLAKKTAEAFADGDKTTVFANIKSFIENHDKGLKADILKQTPKPVSGGADKGITKEQFDKMSYSEMVAFKKENPEAFKQFTEH